MAFVGIIGGSYNGKIIMKYEITISDIIATNANSTVDKISWNKALKRIIVEEPCILLLGLVLLLGPTLVGLYDPISYIAIAIIVAGFLSWLIIRNRLTFPINIPKIAGSLILTFVALYIFSSCLSANKALTVQEAPKLILGILIFFLASQIKKVQHLKIIAGSIIFGALICCILSVGLLNIDYIRNIVINNNRFHGLLGYANALAIYLLVSWLLLVGLISEIERRWWSIACFILTCTLVMTASRISIALWLISGLVVIFILPSRLKILVITASLTGGLSAFVSLRFLLYGNYFIALTCIFLMLAATVFLVEKNKSNTLGLMFWKWLMIAAIGMVIILATFSTYGNWGGIVNRIQSASINSPELQERFAYYSDSSKIIKDYPLLGTGVGGWSSLQYKYQTAVYSVKWVHNEILQVALDNGLPALLVYLMLWIWLEYILIKAIRNLQNPRDKFFIFCLNGAILAMFFQSILDLSLTFPAVKNIYWVTLGSMGAIGNSSKVELAKKNVTFGVLLIITIIIMPLFIADIYSKHALNLYQSGKQYQARLATDKALMLNPMDSKMYNLMGNIDIATAIASKDRSKLAASISNYEKAIRYDNNNPEYYANLGYCYFQQGDLRKSCYYYRNLVELNPLKQSNWDNYAFVLVAMAEQQMQSGDIRSVEINLKTLEAIPAKIEQHLRSLSPRAFHLKHKPQLEISEVIKNSIVRVRWLMKD